MFTRCLVWQVPTEAQLRAGISFNRIFGIRAPKLAQHFESTLPVLVQSLSFARVASVVRACAFKIEPGTRPEDLRFPFVGPARAAQICDIATTGTTLELEQHR